MKIKYKNEIFVNGFLPALGKLLEVRGLTPASSFVLGKFQQEIARNAEVFQKAHQKLLDEYAEKDKKGKPKTKVVQGPQGELTRTMLRKKGRKEFEKKFEELSEIEQEYELMKKVKINETSEIKWDLTPVETVLLEDLVEIEIEEDK